MSTSREGWLVGGENNVIKDHNGDDREALAPGCFVAILLTPARSAGAGAGDGLESAGAAVRKPCKHRWGRYNGPEDDYAGFCVKCGAMFEEKPR